MRTKIYSPGVLASAAGVSREVIKKTAADLGITPERTEGGHRRWNREQAVEIVRALEERRQDPVLELREAVQGRAA